MLRYYTMNKLHEDEILLSICIPTRDRITAAKENALKCLSYNLEWLNVVITVDDPLQSIVEEFKWIDNKRLKYYVNGKSLGYANLAKSLFNGDGKYCLLLADVDRIFDVDWEIVKRQLEDNDNIGLYMCDYYDSQGNILANCRDGFIEAGTTNIYNYAIRCTSWSGGIVLKRDDLHYVWNDIEKDTIIWHFYSQSVCALHIVENRNCSSLKGISIVRAPSRIRTNRTFECDNSNKAYWEIESRNKQILSWIREVALIIKDVDSASGVIYRSILMRNYDFAVKYFRGINFNYSEYTTKYIQDNKEHFASHLNMNLNDWIFMLDDINRNIKDSILKVYGCLPKQYEEHNIYFKERTVESIKALYALYKFEIGN